MTDRELLELAAKACGYDTSHHWNAMRLTLDPPVIALAIPDVSTGWNPLTDDGDALRLAAALDIEWSIIRMPHAEGVQAYNGTSPAVYERFTDDKTATIRLAIVRAAAGLAAV